MIKKNYLFIIFGILFILSLNNLFALGITPGRTTINFEPGLTKEISFSILNSDHKEMSVVFAVRGELSEYISFDTKTVEFSSSEKSKSFSYTVNLPEDYREFGEPGKHKAEIVVLELPKDIPENSNQGPTFIASVAVITQLYVDVPYPNKYAEASLEVIGSNSETLFVVPINNKGKIDIVNARAEIDIYNSMNERVETIQTNSDSISALKRKDLSAKWDSSNTLPGNYLAKASVFYDDEIINLEKEFQVGQRALEILEINIDNFRLGGIAKFEALVENKWSEEVKDVYLNIHVYNNEGEVMADFKSPTYNILELSKEILISYWDTAGVKKGTYDGKLFLKYDDMSYERNIQLKITDDNIEVVGITGRVIIDDGEGFNLTNILVIIIVLLIMINVIWFFIVKRLIERKKR